MIRKSLSTIFFYAVIGISLANARGGGTGSPGLINYEGLKVNYSRASGPTLYVRNYTFSPLSQKDFNDTELYENTDWAKEHWKLTCLSTVYAIIEKARGNQDYRIGEEVWSADGAIAISGTGPGYIESLNLETIKRELVSGNPVILRAESETLDQYHFMLAVGVTADGSVIALDPYGGNTVTLNTESWTGSSAGGDFTVVEMRTVDM